MERRRMQLAYKLKKIGGSQRGRKEGLTYTIAVRAIQIICAKSSCPPVKIKRAGSASIKKKYMHGLNQCFPSLPFLV
jgi:hypothetical protein